MSSEVPGGYRSRERIRTGGGGRVTTGHRYAPVLGVDDPPRPASWDGLYDFMPAWYLAA